jgi:hypothetical protein
MFTGQIFSRCYIVTKFVFDKKEKWKMKNEKWDLLKLIELFL